MPMRPEARVVEKDEVPNTKSADPEAEQRDGAWVVTKAVMSRSARRLMEGVVLVPSDAFSA